MAGLIDEVVASRQRFWAAKLAGQPHLGTPGCAGAIDAGVLDVYDDRALELLTDRRDDLGWDRIILWGEAPRVKSLLCAHPALRPERTAAMICRDPGAAATYPLPAGLRLTPVRFGDTDDPALPPLRAAVEAGVRAFGPPPDADQFEAFVEDQWPRNARVLVAMDATGTVRGTSAGFAVGSEGLIALVSTDPAWRRRGIALALTGVAVRETHRLGAQTIVLSATDLGVAIYRRLGFMEAGVAHHFTHHPAP